MSNSMSLTWLGQSGFIIRSPETVIACDLYLSDYCQKISRLDHTRMMPIPVEPQALTDIDHYLITHSHIDHFDPETVGSVMNANSQTVFYCPPESDRVIEEHFSTNEKRFLKLNSSEEYKLSNSVRLFALPAAHEELEQDDNGEYIAYSYLLLFDDQKKAVFFGGDTIPYDGQCQYICKYLPENYKLILVLPVNGRDAERAELGFKGNLTLDEAVKMYKELNADVLVPCHFGMFALNDIKEDLHLNCDCNMVIPEVNKGIEV